MTVLEVGQPYIAGRARWPEGGEYNYRSGEHELRLFLKSLSPTEIEAVRRGKSEFALVVEGPVIFFMYRFGDSVNWSDSPYSWHLVPEDQRTLPDPPDLETRALLHVILVDADTGMVRALRALTFSPIFTRWLYAMIRVQATTPWIGDIAYALALGMIYDRYPTSADLLDRAVARTVGGA